MLTFLTTILTLALLPAFLGHFNIADGEFVDGTSLYLNYKSRLGGFYNDNEDHFILCLKTGKRRPLKCGEMMERLDIAVMNYNDIKRCEISQGGNWKYRIFNIQRVFSKCFCEDGSIIVKQDFLRTRIRYGKSLLRPTTCVLKLNISCMANPDNNRLLYHVMNIKRVYNISGLLMHHISCSYYLVILCIRPNQISRLVNHTETTHKQDETLLRKLPPEKGLRVRRHILMNVSASRTYSTYFAHDSSHTTPLLRTTPSMVTQYMASTSIIPLACPEIAVINNTTIYLTRSTSEGNFHNTLVPTSQLTPAPWAVLQSLIVNRTRSTAYLTVINQTLLTPSATYNLTEARTSRENATTYIYNSRLVSIVRSAQNSSYVFITTWDCASVTKKTRSSQSLHSSSTTTRAPKSDDGAKKMKMMITFAVAGGTILTFIVIVVLVIVVRRYRRIQSLRRKKKQISYFNRYDRSSAWDDEPFGGSRLSVFTLKNSKFDIADWESTDGKKQEAKMKDDFDSR